jgi:excisionase family DNA binding protein
MSFAPERTGRALLVSPKIAEEMLGVCHKTLYNLLNAGELESLRVGNARRITIASIEALIQRGIQANRPKDKAAA